LPLLGKDTGSLDEKIELMLEKACPQEGEGITDKISPCVVMVCDTLRYLPDISIIFDAPCLFFTPVALCFVYTLWRFCGFSETNLLT
jgi:hypothetical protein